MPTLNDTDLLIVYRPEDGTHYKVTFEELKQDILELVVSDIPSSDEPE